MKRRGRRGMTDESREEVQVVAVVSRGVSKKRHFITRWVKRVNIALSSVKLCARLAVSFVAAAYDGWLRKQRSLASKLTNAVSGFSHVFTFSKYSLPTFTSAVTNQNSSLESGCQIVGNPVIICEPNSNTSNERRLSEEPEASVHVEVLHDPRPRPIRADIIFIHGLHGSLVHTWKQGLWSDRKEVENRPLEHKYKLDENHVPETRIEEGKSLNGRLTESEASHSRSRGQCDAEYDHLLENITDLINNIDDKIKESKDGSAERDTDAETEAEKGKEPYSTCWPRDWLPKDCPGVRVIAVNYTTDPFLWRPIWIHKRIRSSMTLRSRQMEDMLLELGVGEYPVVWVGHSKGGLFVKQMLVDAKNSENPRLSKFLNQTKGIMFYSVPHRGSSLACWNLPFLRQSVELTEVKKDCHEVIELHKNFIKLFEEKSLTAEVFSFVETVMTFMFVTNVRVVSVDSADLGLGSFRGVNIDHRQICKPLNRDCFLYKELVNLINRVV